MATATAIQYDVLIGIDQFEFPCTATVSKYKSQLDNRSRAYMFGEYYKDVIIGVPEAYSAELAEFGLTVESLDDIVNIEDFTEAEKKHLAQNLSKLEDLAQARYKESR